ncbi:DUF5000 domain-containing lipoprotein [Marinoscillum sp. MHG1-6]|uniref:DUF5000 domain-containing lipoprotein n=1 Tax=Marinoscillum sp. MHG1-6 TaxID=2959627 RepID=UPI0021576EE6|nr:DUF5000 domain-containing lipoprotein [Marinoscillum sp. MHG1-6]
MKSNYLIKLLLLVGVAFLFSCEEGEFREPLEKSDAVPQNVSEITFTSLAGAVKMSFTLPDDPNVSHVSVKYETTSGIERVLTSSVYSNSIILDGFADLEEHEIEIYTVSKGNVKSEVITKSVSALEAPIWKVQRELEFPVQFGGFNIEGTNADSSIVSVLIMEKNEFDEFEVSITKSFATALKKIERKIRGLDTSVYVYKVFVMDKWKNSTDTTTIEIKPLFETRMLKENYKYYPLSGDAPQVSNNPVGPEAAFDGRNGWGFVSFTTDKQPELGPHMLTYDVGEEFRLSRWWYQPYPEFGWDPALIQYYYLATLKEFEIYGSTAPSVSGDLDDSWTLMGSFVIEKPSGAGYGKDTPEDIATAEAGLSFEFSPDLPKVRYIRIRCLENFVGGPYFNIGEMEFFGDPR